MAAAAKRSTASSIRAPAALTGRSEASGVLSGPAASSSADARSSARRRRSANAADLVCAGLPQYSGARPGPAAGAAGRSHPGYRHGRPSRAAGFIGGRSLASTRTILADRGRCCPAAPTGVPQSARSSRAPQPAGRRPHAPDETPPGARLVRGRSVGRVRQPAPGRVQCAHSIQGARSVRGARSVQGVQTRQFWSGCRPVTGLVRCPYPGAQPRSDLFRRIGPSPTLRPCHHNACRRDTGQAREADHLPPTHPPRLVACRPPR